jgi:hypothetical protein
MTSANRIAAIQPPAGCESRRPLPVPSWSTSAVLRATELSERGPRRRVQVASGADPKETALRALLRGPTAEEVRAGYMSNFT